jgi:hypothetical protein
MAEAGMDGRGAFLTEKVDNLKDLATICLEVDLLSILWTSPGSNKVFGRDRKRDLN